MLSPRVPTDSDTAGQKLSDNVVKLKSELMTILTAELNDPNSKDIQGLLATLALLACLRCCLQTCGFRLLS